MNIKMLDYFHGGLTKQILERDNFKCIWCGSRKDLAIDHIKPVRDGGSHSLENQRTLCRSCHSKHTLTKKEYQLTSIGKYLRQWRKDHPGYITQKGREFRKRNPGYNYRKGRYQFYKEAPLG